MDTSPLPFEQARIKVLAHAEDFYGRSFEDWGHFYGWLLDIDRDRLLQWEFERIECWDEIVRQSSSADAAPLNVEGLKRNAERAFALFGIDANPTRDSAYDFPRGGEWQMRAASQMHDPDSPLNRGYEDWEQYDMAP